jgi:hypothetical protein
MPAFSELGEEIERIRDTSPVESVDVCGTPSREDGQYE